MEVERLKAFPVGKKEGKKFAFDMATEYLKEAPVKIKYLGGGSFGRAYKVAKKDGESFVVKLLTADGMAKKDFFDLALIHDKLSVKSPRPYFVRLKDEKIPCDGYIMEYLDGKPLLFSLKYYFAPKKKRTLIGERIVDSLHELHLVKSDKFGDAQNPMFDAWIDYYKPFAYRVLCQARKYANAGELSKKITLVMERAWDMFDKIFCEAPQTACLIHGDLNVGNVLISKKGDIAFIDPLSSLFADVEYDLFQFYNLTGRRFFLGKIYRRKYGESSHIEDKLAFYALWNEVFCFIKSGVIIPLIMNPLVHNMKRRLKILSGQGNESSIKKKK